MSILSLSIEERISCLGELLCCNGNMFSWVYDAQGTLLDTNCEELILNTLFSATDCMQYMLEYGRENCAPLVLSIPYGLMWSAAFEFSGEELAQIYALGPVSTPETQTREISKAISQAQMPRTWVPKLIRNLERVPTVMVNQFFQHTLMLHYCVIGEKLSAGDIMFQRTADISGKK